MGATGAPGSAPTELLTPVSGMTSYMYFISVFIYMHKLLCIFYINTYFIYRMHVSEPQPKVPLLVQISFLIQNKISEQKTI